jgi:hypothetical protein
MDSSLSDRPGVPSEHDRSKRRNPMAAPAHTMFMHFSMYNVHGDLFVEITREMAAKFRD